MYDVHCTVVTDMTFLKKDDIVALDGDFPEFKVQVQKLAAKRALRFGTWPVQSIVSVQRSLTWEPMPAVHAWYRYQPCVDRERTSVGRSFAPWRGFFGVDGKLGRIGMSY